MDGHSGGDDLRVDRPAVAQQLGHHEPRPPSLRSTCTSATRPASPTIADAQNAWLGGSSPNTLKYSDTNWHAGPSSPASTPAAPPSRGRSVDGVLPEDQRRTGEFAWPAPKGSYPHEGLQGAVVASVILHRAGVLTFNAGDRALERAERWLTDDQRQRRLQRRRQHAVADQRVRRRRLRPQRVGHPGKNIALGRLDRVCVGSSRFRRPTDGERER